MTATTGRETPNAATAREYEAETAHRSAVPAEAPPERAHSALRALRARGNRILVRFVKPVWAVAVGDRPSLWSQAPTTGPELIRYARDAEWCAPDRTFVRWLGRAYCVVIAIPFSTIAYLAAWIVQRPGRFGSFLLLCAIVTASLWLAT